MSLLAVLMPKWGLAMDEGTLASWLVDKGAMVSAGDAIAEIETSKIANVLEAPASGIVRRRVALAGDLRAVGGLLAVIASNGESDAEIDAFIARLVAAEAAVEAAAPPRREPQTMVIDGAAIRYFTVPATEPTRAGTPLVLIHGFGGDYLNWMFNQAVLAADREVHAIDLPGHGGSAKEVGDGSLDALVARIIAWLDAMELTSVHLAGHSLGAAVGIAMARAAPERVRSLIAIAAAGLGTALDRSYVEDFIAAGRRKELTPVVERLFADPSIVTREMVDDLIAYKRIDGVTQSLRALADGALSEASLDRLQTELSTLSPPLLALFGDSDRIVTGRLLTLSSCSAMMVGAGHMPHLEAADEVNQHMAAFLSTND